MWKAGEATFSIRAFDASWYTCENSHWRNLQTKTGADRQTIQADYNFNKQYGQVEHTIRRLDQRSFELDCRFRFDGGATFYGIVGSLTIPCTTTGLWVNGRHQSLPAAFGKLQVLKEDRLQSLRVNLRGGLSLTVSGTPKLSIQDNRKFNKNGFSLRFPFSPASGTVEESRLRLTFQVDPVPNQSVDLSAIVNRGFADRQAGDGQGGWSDQGPGNDFRMFNQRKVQVQGLTFDVLDPEINNGRSVAVVGGTLRPELPRTLRLKLPEGTSANAINLLHASAWTPKPGSPIGEITVRFADDSSQTITVVSGRDCGNWWLESPGQNAAIAWAGENAVCPVGLYASSFAIRQSNPREISFKSADHPKVMWMLVGVNLSDAPVTFAIPKDKEISMVADKQWLPLTFKRETRRGSALDFSWTQDAPAGKYGFIQATPEGTLAFEKASGKRIRLFGVNLCLSANFLSKASVDRLADKLVLAGYNAVRIHHHDTAMLDPKASDSLTFDPAKLDRLDYLFHAMKQRGLYITTDFYTNRRFKAGDRIPECTSYTRRQMKVILPVSPRAMDNWKTFVRRWMAHKNPYTGLTWREDPALFAVNLVNEDPLILAWSATPESRALYTKRFKLWQTERGLSGGKPSSDDRLFNAFLLDLQDRCLVEQIRFVKEDLKLKTMVTSLNLGRGVPLTLMRRRFDLVDNHTYFDHPSFPEESYRLPFQFRQQSSIRRLGQVPRNMGPTRIFGKPFMITEFNYCAPNKFRAEGGPLMGAYAGLQDWDALFRFAWSHASFCLDKSTPVVGFDAVNDPLAQLSDRIALAMFLRGDIAPARKKFAYRVSPRLAHNDNPMKYPPGFETLGLIAQIGSCVEGENPPAGCLPVFPAISESPEEAASGLIQEAWRQAIDRRTAASSTGQIVLDAENTSLAVKTPKLATATLKKGSLKAGSILVKQADSFQTVAAIALDDKPLSDSSSILVLHLTDVVNTKMLFGNERKTILKRWGSLPLLVRRGKSRFFLASPHSFTVTALSADGDPLGQVPGKTIGNSFAFALDPGHFPGGVMAYHLTR
jgi:hypothetical protein